MGIYIRGVKNAFRNTVRTVSVTLILAISISLALVMLLSYRTVENRIATVKGNIGNTITISPAGARGFEGGGEPLTETQLDTVKTLDHVTSVSTTLNDRLDSTTTNLVSAIEAGTLGNRVNRQNRRGGTTSRDDVPSTTQPAFTPPIMVTGVSDTAQVLIGDSKLSSGEAFATDSEENVALIGSALATKNTLSVGSTFTVHGETVTVKGIFEAGNQFGNSGLYMPLKTVQRLAEQPGEVSSATIQVDSIDNLEAVTAAVKEKLGTTADVVSNEETSKAAITPLENIKGIALSSLFGALAAGAVITLLIMTMIVRERRREIGVLKAIGSSNIGVVMQFVTESMVLTGLGAIAGTILGVLLSNPVLEALVKNSATAGTAPETVTRGFGGPGGFMRVAQVGGGVQNAVKDLQNVVGLDIVLYGILAAVLIAVIGSALPAWLIAKVKPAEVMRIE